MESSIHRFVLRHARRETLWVLALTLGSLPIYYLSLDIPKNIMNQAIVGKGMTWPTEVLGFQLGQVQYLFVLCAAFLLAVLANGSLKQYINTLKGRLGERLLRRLRYELTSRVLRFPLPHFRKVSAGEIIPMITSEVEPIGGYMGDAFAQPLIQLGTLGTIVVFLFIQNPIMGAAAISLYPLQAYLIPKLQRRVNQLGKQRVRAVRRVSERIGETVAGIQEIRAQGTSMFERAHYADHFGRIYAIRFEIYQRKAFVKFLNNFLNQLAPLLFYSIGGYLVIHGDLTVGALTAALTANKDMSAPWKELLDWYQQTQDAKIKYEQVTEQFRPENMIDDTMQLPLAAAPATPAGPLRAVGIGVVDETGVRQLEGVSVDLEIPSRVALSGPVGGGKDVFAQVLARLVPPTSGRIAWGERDYARMGEGELGARLGYVGPSAYVFSASVRDNLLYGLKQRVVGPAMRDGAHDAQRRRYAEEARRSGNTDLDSEADWVDAAAAGVDDPRQFDARLLDLLARVDLAEDIYNLGLRGRIDPTRHPERARTMLAARAAVAERLETPDLRPLVERFDPRLYNTNATIAENLLFGTPVEPAFEVDALAGNPDIVAALDRVGLTHRLVVAGRQVAATMTEIFADLPAGHELFQQYSFLTADELAELPGLLARVGPDGSVVNPADRARLLSLPFKLVDARHRLGVIDDELKTRILAARAELRRAIAHGVAFFEPDRYNAAATIQDNILFGKVAYGVARAAARVGRLVAETLDARGLRNGVLEVGLDFQVGVAGARLSGAQRQKLALARALAKRPAILVVNEATQSLDAGTQARVMDGVFAAAGDCLLAWVLAPDAPVDRFDRVLVFAEGRLARITTPGQPGESTREKQDQKRV
jgi:putative ABC transport system ATP-binding protein